MKRVLLVTLLVLFIDQAIKLYIKSTMYIGQEGLDMGFIRILFVENPGMAFGTVLPGAYGKILLSILRFVAIFGIIYYIRKLLKKGAHKGLVTAVSLILAGAIGNLLDSAFYGLLYGESTRSMIDGVAEFMPEGGGYASFLMGSVVDMLQFTVRFPEWFPWWGGDEIFPAIFNIADASITVGVLMILIWQRRYFPKRKQEEVVETNAGQEKVVVADIHSDEE